MKTPPTTQERVDHIVGMMARFEWREGKSDVELAKLWGIAASTVRNSSAEASRVIKREYASNEKLQIEIIQALREGLHRALEDGTDGRKVLAGIAKALADISGVTAPQRLEHTGKDGLPLSLPAPLAMLEPPPSVQEVEHYIETRLVEDCRVDACRVHAVKMLPGKVGE